MTGSRSAAGNYPGSPFVGREPELTALREALASALEGHGRIVLVTGDPGIGKTRTAEEILAEARAVRAEVLWGRCQEWEGAPAYWPWLQILRRYVERTDEATIQTDLAGLASDLAQIMPELVRFADEEPADRPAYSPEQRRFRLFDAMARLLRTVTQRQPVVLVLDDLHWADQPTLRLLEFAAQDIHELPLLLIATYRNVALDRQHPLTGTLAELSRDPASRRIILHGLGSDDIGRYIEQTSDRQPPPGLVEAVLEETEGNPFFMTEVVAWLRSEGRLDEGSAAGAWTVRIPESVREAVGNRLDRLSPETNEVLTAAAVIGREFDLQLLARATEREALELLERLDEAVQAGVLDELEQPGDYRFSHALIRETLYSELTTSRRLRFHMAVGAALEALYANDLAAHYSELAHHFSESALAGNTDKAIDYGVRAGDQATEQAAWESAVAHYAEALDLIETTPSSAAPAMRCDLLLALADAHWSAGDANRGKHFAMAAAQAARELGDDLHLAQAAVYYAGGQRLLVWNSDPVASELIEEALERLPEGQDLICVRLLARAAHFSETTEQSARQAREGAALAVKIAAGLDNRQVLLEALLAEQFAHTFGSDCFQELIVAERASRQARIQQLSTELGSQFMRLMNFPDKLLTGETRLRELDDTLAWFETVSQHSRMPVHRAYTTILQSTIATLEGRFDDAEKLATQATPIAARSSHMPETFSLAGQFLYVIYRERERLAAFIDDVVRFTSDRGWEIYWQIRLLLAQVEIGDIDEASRGFERFANDDFANLPPDWNWLENVATLGEIAFLFDDTERAATIYELLIPYRTYNAVMIFSWDFIGAVAYYLGLLATTLERWGQAEDHFRFALERHEFMGLPPYIANTQHQYAAMLVKRGEEADIDRAQELNEWARSAAREMGMVRLERLTTALAEEIESRDHVIQSDGAPYDLTPRELDVLAYLVRGSTDREIADELSISHRTVQVHVSNILGKLEAGSRTAAAALAIREELV